MVAKTILNGGVRLNDGFAVAFYSIGYRYPPPAMIYWAKQIQALNPQPGDEFEFHYLGDYRAVVLNAN